MKPRLRPGTTETATVTAPMPCLAGIWFYGLVLLLIAEGILLAVRYHWTMIGEERHGAVRVLIEPVLPVSLAAAVLTVAKRRRGALDPTAPHVAQSPRWLFVAGHLAAFAGFARVLAYLVAGDPAISPYPDARLVGRLFGTPWTASHRPYWIGLSLVLGLASIALWERAVVPLARSRTMRWPGWEPLAVGFGVGAASIGAGWLARAAWLELGGATLWVVQHLLELIFPEVVCRPSERVIGTPAFTVWIAPVCAGYEGIGLVVLFVVVYLWLDRRHLRFPLAFWLLPVGALLMWLANAMRIAALVAVGVWISPQVAARGFHVQAGWLALNTVALGLVAVAQQSRFARIRQTKVEGPSPTAAYLLPLLAAVATGMVTGALSEDFDRLYPLRILAALTVLIAYRHVYTGLRWAWSWPAFALGLLVFVLWLVTEPASTADVGASFRQALADLTPGWAWFWLVGRVLGSVLVIPLAEELAFRGYLLRRLMGADFQAVPSDRLTWPALLISSILFGVLHERWLAGMAAGVAYALAQRHRGRLSDAVLAHSTTNGLLTAHALATGNWSSWS